MKENEKQNSKINRKLARRRRCRREKLFSPEKAINQFGYTCKILISFQKNKVYENKLNEFIADGEKALNLKNYNPNIA